MSEVSSTVRLHLVDMSSATPLVWGPYECQIMTSHGGLLCQWYILSETDLMDELFYQKLHHLYFNVRIISLSYTHETLRWKQNAFPEARMETESERQR